MSLMKESRNNATIRVTDRVWSTLQDHRVAFRKLDREKVRAIVLDKNAVVEEYTTVSTTRLQTMGAHSYLMDNVVFESVGRYCSIADGVAVMGVRHPLESVTTSNVFYVARLQSAIWARQDFLGAETPLRAPRTLQESLPVIENDVWIGNNVLLKRGITLHTGCVVGAGSIVTKDVSPYAIVAGNPARIIRMRFNEALVERLLASAWWDKHPKAVMSGDLQDPERFLDQIAGAERYIYRTLTWRDLI